MSGTYNHEGAHRCKRLVAQPARKRGRVPGPAKVARVEAVMLPSLVHAAKIAAAVRGVSLSSFVAEAVRAHLGGAK